MSTPSRLDRPSLVCFSTSCLVSLDVLGVGAVAGVVVIVGVVTPLQDLLVAVSLFYPFSLLNVSAVNVH